MALYEFHCDRHGSFDANAPMSEPHKWRRCPECKQWCKQSFTVPNFQEDRTRLFRNAVDGSKKSWTLGKEMPDTRHEYYKELDRLGAEPVSRATMPQAWKDNLDYKKHVDTGGERVPAFEKAAHPATKPGELTVLKQLQKSGVRIG